MSRLLRLSLVPVLAIGLAFATGERSAQAGGFSLSIGGFSIGNGYHHGYRSYYRPPIYRGHHGFPSHHSYRYHHPRRPHYDYHPPTLVPHGNHFDYVPGHWDYHHRGHGRHRGHGHH